MVGVGQGNALSDVLLQLGIKRTEPVTSGLLLHRCAAPGLAHAIIGLQRQGLGKAVQSDQRFAHVGALAELTNS
jgi:hypothetical protein